MKTPPVRLPARVLALAKNLGPYAALELFVPGGSLIALALLALKHYHAAHREVRS